MMMYYTIYKITNICTGKCYIGAHKTNDINDVYFGSGKYITRAIKLYGMNMFRKDILFIYDNASEMYNKEAELVTNEFICSDTTYNLKIGGYGGWDYINSNLSDDLIKIRKENANKTNIIRARRLVTKLKSDATFRKYFSERVVLGIRKSAFERYGDEMAHLGGFLGKTHSEHTKRIIGEKNAILQLGKNNSQFNTKWIYSEYEKLSKKIPKNSPIPEGWLAGRKIKW